MHGCSWKEGWEGLLKSSTLGKGERRGWADGVCSPQGDAATQCYKHSQTLSSSLSLLLIHLTYPLWTPTHPLQWPTPPATRHNLTQAWKGCVFVCVWEGGWLKWNCVACVMVFYHLLSHNTLGIVYVSMCVCVCGQGWLDPVGPIVRGCCTINCQAEDMSPKGWRVEREKDRHRNIRREGRRMDERRGRMSRVEQTHAGTGVLLFWTQAVPEIEKREVNTNKRQWFNKVDC